MKNDNLLIVETTSSDVSGKKVFRKEKMIARLKEEGRLDQLDEEGQKILDLLDGLEIKPNLWRQTVYGEDAWYVQLPDGRQFPVNRKDCS